METLRVQHPEGPVSAPRGWHEIVAQLVGPVAWRRVAFAVAWAPLSLTTLVLVLAGASRRSAHWWSLSGRWTGNQSMIVEDSRPGAVATFSVANLPIGLVLLCVGGAIFVRAWIHQH